MLTWLFDQRFVAFREQDSPKVNGLGAVFEFRRLFGNAGAQLRVRLTAWIQTQMGELFDRFMHQNELQNTNQSDGSAIA